MIPLLGVPLLPLLVLPAALLQTPQEPTGEGPLRNDTHLVRSELAQAELTRGDASWRRAREGGADRTLARIGAFEGWRGALMASAAGDSVLLADPAGDRDGAELWPDPDGTHGRRSEGVAEGVLRRLMHLPEEDRAAWIERFGPEAHNLLEANPYDPAHLAGIERNAPLTRSAALAALRLVDLALERGRLIDARTWLGRGRRHARALPHEEDLAQGLDRREALIARLQQGRAPLEEAEPWREATSLKLTVSVRLESTQAITQDLRPIPLGRGVAPGGIFLRNGALLVQTPRGVALFGKKVLSSGGGNRTQRHSYEELLGIDPVHPFAVPSAGGWPLLPAADGLDVVLVVDRGRGGRLVGKIPLPARGNHLACLRAGPRGGLEERWRLSQEGLTRPGEPTLPWEEAMGLPGRFEFQPGPVAREGRVIVQARGLPHPDAEGVMHTGDVMLFALNLADGTLLWSRVLTRPADLRRRGLARTEVPTSAMPLALAEGVVVAGTNVGLTCAFETVDGRHLWSFRTRRREAEDNGWPGSRPPLIVPADDPLGSSSVLLAPFDSDRLYSLALHPPTDGSLLLSSPLAQGTLMDLAGGGAAELVFLGRDGRHQALRTLDRERGLLRSSLYLGTGERFAGPALTSSSRVFVTSNRGLYLFDRERDLFLLDVGRLKDLGAGVGGIPIARGNLVAVAGRDSVWVYRAE